jgi:sulfite exporter TauE/SafE
LKTDGSARILSNKNFYSHSSYNLGRLTTYLLAGLLLGLVAERLDLKAELLGVSRASVYIFGSVLIFLGISGLVRKQAPTPSMWLHAILSPIMRRIYRFQSSPLRAYLVGLSSTLLPCGWLYAFLSLAASSGSATQATVIMFIFWLGTLPMMLGVGFGAGTLLRLGSKYSQRISSGLVLLAGILSIFLHSQSVAQMSVDDNSHQGAAHSFLCLPSISEK